MNFSFYIFGTPHNFDLYPYNAKKTYYYQKYEYGDSENVELIIQRTGFLVTYSYIRYNLLSVTNKQKAFFGMALDFGDKYCTDVKELYRLFDEVYNELILKRNILLQKTSNGQIKFSVFTFKIVDSEIRKVEAIIRKNIESAFVSNLKTINKSFKQGVNENILKKLNIDKSNAIILKAMKDYPRLSLSHEYMPQIIVTPPYSNINSSNNGTIAIIKQHEIEGPICNDGGETIKEVEISKIDKVANILKELLEPLHIKILVLVAFLAIISVFVSFHIFI